MIAALLCSVAPSRGPAVNRRSFRRARVKGGNEADLIQIGSVSRRGPGLLELAEFDERLTVEHIEASGEPVSVELF
jgi:hypothetical protein